MTAQPQSSLPSPEGTTLRHGIVLLLLVGIYLGASATEAEWMTPLVMAMATSIVLVVAIRYGTQNSHVVMFLILLAGATVFASILALLARRATGFSDLIVAAILVFAILLIGRTIVQAQTVTPLAVTGAVDIYILIGLAFGFLFSGLERVSEVAFFNTGMLADRGDFLYFSFVAMTTLGFGDLAPAANYARPLTVLEVLTGQIILVVVVARVVSMLGQSRPSNDPDN